MNQMSKYIAEAVGTFWLAFAGCGSAVIAAGFPQVGIGLLGVSLAFGLTVLTIAYSIGHISGCHLNPAVTIGLTAGGRFPSNQVLFYIIAQAGRGRDRRRGALHHRQWRTRLRSGQRARGQRVRRTLAGPIRPCLGRRGGVRAHRHVLVRHHGIDARQGTGGLCSDRHWLCTDLDPSRLDPGHEHLSQPGAQHGSGPLRGWMGAGATLAVLGGAYPGRRGGRGILYRWLSEEPSALVTGTDKGRPVSDQGRS